MMGHTPFVVVAHAICGTVFFLVISFCSCYVDRLSKTWLVLSFTKSSGTLQILGLEFVDMVEIMANSDTPPIGGQVLPPLPVTNISQWLTFPSGWRAHSSDPHHQVLEETPQIICLPSHDSEGQRQLWKELLGSIWQAVSQGGAS